VAVRGTAGDVHRKTFGHNKISSDARRLQGRFELAESEQQLVRREPRPVCIHPGSLFPAHRDSAQCPMPYYPRVTPSWPFRKGLPAIVLLTVSPARRSGMVAAHTRRRAARRPPSPCAAEPRPLPGWRAGVRRGPGFSERASSPGHQLAHSQLEASSVHLASAGRRLSETNGERPRRVRLPRYSRDCQQDVLAPRRHVDTPLRVIVRASPAFSRAPGPPSVHRARRRGLHP
jgi:hypothetical protein